MLPLALQGLEATLNKILALDPDSKPRLQALQGKIIKIEIQDWPVEFYLVVNGHGVELHNNINATADTMIRGKLDALFYAGCSKGKNSVLFKNRIEIRGDIDTGEKIRDLLAKLDIDWEEQLAQRIGDIAAHKIGSTFEKLRQFGQQTGDTVASQLRDFLQIEAQTLPSKAQVQQFIDDVTQLQHAVERAQARILRLKTQKAAS